MKGNDLGSCETIGNDLGDFEFETRIIGKKAGYGLRSYFSLKMWILGFLFDCLYKKGMNPFLLIFFYSGIYGIFILNKVEFFTMVLSFTLLLHRIRLSFGILI
jgi:hypothetical protein